MKLTLPSIKGITTLTLFFSLFLFISCADPVDPINGINGLDGFNALVEIQTEIAGDNCSEGGLKISVGQDDNANGTLDESEIESISYVCNGSAGSDGSSPSNLLARTSAEEPGENCDAGGTLIEIGSDDNSNGSLESTEILSSFFLCNGSDGSDGVDGNNGTDGNDGEDGSNGSDGVDGLDGFSSIIKATAEPSGDNCSSGGLKIEIGLDANADQELDSDEIQSTYYICNGANGSNGTNGTDGSNGTDGVDGLNTLSNVISEPAGSNCSNGGFKIEVGVDSNRNNVLDNSEVSSENYVCNGADGENGNNGFSSLIRISTEASGDNCSAGGMKIEVGLDDVTSNGELDIEEVDFTQYVCNGINGSNGTDGANGLNSIIQTTTVEPGSDCSNGGIEIQIGLDTNGNSELDEGEEIGGSFYVCNGTDGVDGSDGINGADGADGVDGRDVIVISSPASTCANGGSTLEFGYDGNNDGDLSDIEDTMLTIITICNGIDGSDGSDGANGFNTIIITETEAPGDNCANGGLALNVGLDINGNNQIDAGEESGTFYVCNGADGSDGSDGTNGNNSLITVTSFGGNQNGCPDGGLTIRTGIDDNGNGVLNVAEIDATSYVCNGSDGTDGTDGSDGADGNSDSVFEFYFQEGFDGYTGVVDLAISDKNGNEGGNTFSVDNLSGSESHGLLQFPDLDKMAETIGTTEFEIVEAILYLKGRSVRVDGANSDNWIGVRTISSSVPLFDPDAVSWSSIDGNQNWSEPGVTSNDNLGDANEYSDMYRLPNDIVFNGYIPLLLNKSEVETMTDKTTNKGLVLLMANDGVPYELDIISSDNKNVGVEGDRPLLYIKTKVTTRGRTEHLSHQEQKNVWDQMSYEQKMAPLRRKK